MTPTVVDIYHGDNAEDTHGPIDFAAWKAAGIVGVIHKCTQGATYADPLYAARRRQATAAGLLWGAYTFNTGQDVAAQVDSFLTHADPGTDTLMALDFEDNPHSQMSLAQMMQFLDLADQRLGRKLVLYSGNRVVDLLGRQTVPSLGSRRLWRPQYPKNPTTFSQVVLQNSWTSAWLWQYTETGTMVGCRGQLDLNAYDGPANKLAAEWAV